ncbi:MAG TPA: DUF4136 domain-containing protein [Helicobacteraceae bacterium]|nr:DUF4136 domain-containing protein [Helicobacteraceae bacterium]
MYKFLLSALIIAIFSGCSSIRVSSDYDPDFKAQTLHAYAIINKNKSGDDTLTMDRIEHAINHNLAQKGYHKVEKDGADFYILYHINVESKTRIDTDYQYVGLYPYRFGGGMVATTNTVNYDEGKLIIDIINPQDNKILWRSTATDRLHTLDTPEERTEYINEVIAKALEKFPQRERAGL